MNISGTLGQVLLGIDFRPQNGLLYGLGSGGGVFAIDRTSGVATLASLLSTPTSGTSFGVDFNPIPDRLRVVSGRR